jgi:outer membrane protein assembly factor BamB
MRYILSLIATSILLTGCSFFDDEKDAPPLPGERISVIDLERELKPEGDPATINLPPTVNDSDWVQSANNAQHLMGNLETIDLNTLERIWQADIGEGRASRIPLTAIPVIAGGKIFTLDTTSRVSAFNIQTGETLWSKKARPKTEDENVIAGGLAVSGNMLFITAGYNEVLAVNTDSGELVWRQTITAGSRAAPTILNNRVFVKTLNDNLIALNAADGAVIWEYEGIGETSGLLGTASPAADDQIVVGAFSSGDIVTLRVENGSVVWSDRLVNTLQMGSLSTLADIRGHPVIEDNRVYAVSYGGKLAAVDKGTGLRVWTKDISSAETPLVVGNALFILDTQNNLIALDKMTGEVFWIRPTARYANPEKRENPITWYGPMMINSHLVLTGNNGILAIHDPVTGDLLKQYKTGKSVSTMPVTAGGTLFVQAEDGTLMAFR